MGIKEKAMDKFLIMPYMVVLTTVFTLVANAMGKGALVFADASCIGTPAGCGIVVTSDGGFLGGIVAFFQTVVNFFSVFLSFLTFRAQINPTVDAILVFGYITVLLFGIYQLIRAN